MTIHAVAEYAPVGSTSEQLLAYPYDRPDTSFITDGNEVCEMPEVYQAFIEATEVYLSDHHVPGMAERIPVIGYGANVSPYKLREKMAKYGTSQITDELQVVPNLRVHIPNTVIAWHGKPGQVGSIFAELYSSQKTQGETAEAFVQFLTKEQLAAIHASEGVTYHFVQIPVLAGSDGYPLEAGSYVAGRSEVLLKDGAPVQVKACAKPNATQAMTAQEAMQYILDNVVEVAGTHSPTEYIEQAPHLLSEKKDRQKRVGKKLAELGLSTEFSYPNIADSYKGRADFNFDTDLHQGKQKVELMEQTVARMNPQIKENLRKRAHAELTERKHLSY